LSEMYQRLLPRCLSVLPAIAGSKETTLNSMRERRTHSQAASAFCPRHIRR
jgi:hypothetical protein